jgi:hypothetical protein
MTTQTVKHRLSSRDLPHVVESVPKDVRKLLKEHTLFLAGGFIRAVIAGEKVSDIDLLGPDAGKLLEVGYALALSRAAKVHKTDNALTIISPPRLPIQFITRWTFDDPVTLIEQFDFTIVKACICWDKQAKQWCSARDAGFYRVLAARRLVYTHPKRHEDAGGSMLRVVKYLHRGYNIQADSLAGVMSRMVGAMDVSRLEFVKEDSKRFLPEQWSRSILLSLLRDVDPLKIVDSVEFVDEHEVAVDESQGGTEFAFPGGYV